MPLFKNQSWNSTVLRHKSLPLLSTSEFDFFRCIEFRTSMYGKTISELHAGNLRLSREDNRYSNLFPGQRLSYWADSPITCRAELKRWGAGKNIIMFWAYDDASSFRPTVYPELALKIIDGNQLEFNKILKKLTKKEKLTFAEQDMIDSIASNEPDCLAYNSEAREGSTNFLFFEHGFKKLALREVRLRLGDEKGKNHSSIVCAGTSDYIPYIESYGMKFMPKARVIFDREYLKSDEYILRNQILKKNEQRFRERYLDKRV